MTSYSVGEIVRGDGKGPRVMSPGAVNTFVGRVVEVEPAEKSDVGEEMVLVEYTSPTTWDKLHGTRSDWFFAEEVQPV